MKVLLATDASKNAEKAAWFLARLPHSERLELTILAVTAKHEIHGSPDIMDWLHRNAEAEKLRIAEACQQIERLFAGADATVETVVVEGHPGKTIVAEAKSRKSELVVLGAVGHSALDRMLVGSVSDFVATHAHCSVLIVRPAGEGEREHDGLNVTVAFDDSEQSRFALEQLSIFKWGIKTKAFVVNGLALPLSFSDVPIEIDTEQIKADMRPKVNAAAEKLRGLFADVTSHVIEINHVGEGIIGFAHDHATDLIVLGDTGNGLVGRFLMGSVSRFILRHARCSVWIARKPIE